jgi:hypothetical protein
MFVEIGHGNVGAFAREQHGDRAADAGIGAGDECRHAEQLVGTFVVRRVVHRPQLEVAFAAGFFEMLLGKPRRGVAPRARLHALFGFLGLRRPSAVDALLDRALTSRRGFGRARKAAFRSGVGSGHGKLL